MPSKDIEKRREASRKHYRKHRKIVCTRVGAYKKRFKTAVRVKTKLSKTGTLLYEAHQRALKKKREFEIRHLQLSKKRIHFQRDFAKTKKRFYKWAWKTHPELFGKSRLVGTICCGDFRDVTIYNKMDDIQNVEIYENSYDFSTASFSKLEYMRLPEGVKSGYDIKDITPVMWYGNGLSSELFEEWLEYIDKSKKDVIIARENKKGIKGEVMKTGVSGKIMEWGGEGKRLCRSEITKSLTNKPSKVAAFFPGATSRDVIEALENNTIDRNTKLLLMEGYNDSSRGDFYEVRKGIIRRILPTLKEYDLKNFIIHPDRVHTMPLDKFLDKGEVVDFFNLDLCGVFDQKILDWMINSRNCNLFAPKMRLGLTTSLSVRKTRDTFLNMSRDYPELGREYLIPRFERDLKMWNNMKINVKNDLIDKINELYSGQYLKLHQKYSTLALVLDRMFYWLMDNKGELNGIRVYNDNSDGSAGTPMLFMDVTCDFGVYTRNQKLYKDTNDKINEVLESAKYAELVNELNLPMPESVMNIIRKREEKVVERKVTTGVTGNLVYRIRALKAVRARKINKESDLVRISEIKDEYDKKIKELTNGHTSSVESYYDSSKGKESRYFHEAWSRGCLAVNHRRGVDYFYHVQSLNGKKRYKRIIAVDREDALIKAGLKSGIPQVVEDTKIRAAKGLGTLETHTNSNGEIYYYLRMYVLGKKKNILRIHISDREAARHVSNAFVKAHINEINSGAISETIVINKGKINGLLVCNK